MEKNFYFRQSSLLMLFALFLVAVSLIGCGEQGDDGQAQLTPEALYQTSWRGMGHCDGWTMKERDKYAIHRYPERKSDLERL